MNDTSKHSQDSLSINLRKFDSAFRTFWRRLTGKAVPPVQYFLPGQVLLQVRHPDGLSKEDIAKAVENFMDPSGRNSSTSGVLLKNHIQTLKPESITTIPLKDDQGFVFSLVPAYLHNFEKHHTDHTAMLKMLRSLYQEYENQKKVPIPMAPNITLKSVSPNWIMGAAYHGCATGGPGGWPVQAHEPEGDDWKFYKAQNQDGLASDELLSDGDGAGVHVAILDTAPTRHDLYTAYATWRWGHPLIDRLLRPGDSPLHLYPAENSDLHLTAELSLLGHRYWMRDHGLFVAGIIHTIAPKAKLYLYEALNPYGVASIESIAQSLIKVLKLKEDIDGPLIINCSFMFDIPVKGNLNEDFPREIRENENFKNYLIQTPQDLFERLAKMKKDGIHVIAAAGNDGVHNNSSWLIKKRPSTRYPAAFKGVWGVGALPKKVSLGNDGYRAATYSNLADNKVPPEGYVTLGGEPGVGRGVLGVYTGDFPTVRAKGCLSILGQLLALNIPRPGLLPTRFRALMPEDIEYKRNTTGWAWWAGTSFATPIVTGKVAADYSLNPGDVATIIANASRGSVLADPGGPLPTREQEPVILTAQKAQE